MCLDCDWLGLSYGLAVVCGCFLMCVCECGLSVCVSCVMCCVVVWFVCLCDLCCACVRVLKSVFCVKYNA